MKAAILWSLCVGLHATAWSQDFECKPLPGGDRECVYKDFHPTGPTVITEWRKKNEDMPYKRQITGARSGSLLTGKLQLRMAANRSWQLVDGPDGKPLTILEAGEARSGVLPPIQEGTRRWQLTVTRRDAPPPVPGISAEYESKLDVQILRLKALPVSGKRVHPGH